MKETFPLQNTLVNAYKKCFEAETSTQAGRLNALGSLVCIVIIGFTLASSIVDKILWLINSEYESGIPWYGVIALIALLLAYFIYCVEKITKVNEVNNKIKEIENLNKPI